jgi:HEAT repeat protein
MRFWKLTLITILLALCCGPAFRGYAQQQPVKVEQAAPQQPKITNARLQQLSAASGLRPTIDNIVQKQSGPLWLGYRIPTVAKERTMCCFDSIDGAEAAQANCCSGCRVESEKGVSINGKVSDCTPPEPLPYAFVFLRAEEKQIMRVRVYSANCALDFANLPVYWLEDVKPEQSVQVLAGIALADSPDESGDGRSRAGRQAVMALAMHDHPAADAAFEKMVQPAQPAPLRENAAFWLGVERGKRGVELLHKYIKEDPDERVRERGTFAFSQSKEPEARKDLIDMARHDQSPRVRGQAIFWMAQIGSRKEAEQITAAIEDDPDTQVKKKAVFALSQMHNGDAVPLLINLAKTNKNPVVRKQAIFWLGQSKDPRALDFLEEILTKQ